MGQRMKDLYNTPLVKALKSSQKLITPRQIQEDVVRAHNAGLDHKLYYSIIRKAQDGENLAW
jgi:hypothetical protein